MTSIVARVCQRRVHSSSLFSSGISLFASPLHTLNPPKSDYDQEVRIKTCRKRSADQLRPSETPT